METKICTACGKEKNATNEYFSKAKRGKNGLASECKECNKIYRVKHQEKLSQQKKEWYQNNKEATIKRVREYSKNNKDKLSKKTKEYYEKTKEERLKYAKDYRENNREKVAEVKNKWYKENKEAVMERARETSRIYRSKNKDKINIKTNKRRAKKKQLPNTLNAKQWNDIKIKFNNKCAYCGQEKKLEQEHFIPLSKGGEYTHNNIIPACRSCNGSKHNYDFYDWYPSQEFYSKEREDFILNHLGYRKNIQQLKII